jgi:hypothetical protein
MSPWLLLCLFGFVQFITGKVKNLAGAIACLIVGAFFAWIGLLLPSIWWISYFVYPVGHFILFLLLVIYVAVYNKNKIASKTAITAAT